jgi:hypothetical protein
MAAKSEKYKSESGPWYFRPYLLGLLLAIAGAVTYFLIPLSSNKFNSWNPGQMHSAHQMLNNNCQACHQNNFEKINDAACSQCHNMSDHGEVLGSAHIPVKDKLKSEGACVDCHFEHAGHEALIHTEDKLCSNCHSDLASTVANPSFKNVVSFTDHPDISVNIGDKRLVLNSDVKDLNTLKLNHAIHLKKDLRGPNGPVQMQCSDCHQFNSSGYTSEKISFEKNCRSCHQLTFDDDLPESKVPHGNESLVIPHLITEYAKLAGQSKLIEDSSLLRSVPGKVKKESRLDPRLVKIIAEAREAEELLFTKTSCNLCHEVSLNTDVLDLLQSKYKVQAPEIPQPWLSHAKFPHSSHEMESCESCHDGVLTSEKTEDILLPQIDNCQKCHIDPQAHRAGSSKIKSNCISCHGYHQQKPLSKDQKLSLEPLLNQILESNRQVLEAKRN